KRLETPFTARPPVKWTELATVFRSSAAILPPIILACNALRHVQGYEFLSELLNSWIRCHAVPRLCRGTILFPVHLQINAANASEFRSWSFLHAASQLKALLPQQQNVFDSKD